VRKSEKKSGGKSGVAPNIEHSQSSANK